MTKMIKQIVDFSWARYCSGNKHITKTTACLTALLLGAGVNTAAAADPELLFSMNTTNLTGSEGATIASWDGATAITSWQGDGNPLAGPTVKVIGANKWVRNYYADNVGEPWVPTPGSSWGKWTGFNVLAPSTSIPLNGATFVVVVKPIRSTDSGNWRSVVDVMYDKMVLGIANDNGKICVRRNGGIDWSAGAIPDGQATVLTLTVQTDGSYEVWANGVSAMTGGANGSMTEWDPNRLVSYDEPDWANTATLSGMTVGQGNWDQWWAAVRFLEPTVTAAWDWANFNALPNRDTYWGWMGQVQPFKRSITVGRNAPDGWTAYNGYIGDVYVFTNAIDTAKRTALEAELTAKFMGVSTYTIAASAGANGTISPSGAVTVSQGDSQTFNFTPNLGYEVSDIVVDGDDTVTLAPSYTFTNVTNDHTIVVSFAEQPKQWVSGKVTDGASGILGAKVYFKTSANAAVNPTFTTNTVDAAGNYSMLLPPGAWYTTARDVHYFTTNDMTFTVASSPVTVPDIVLTANPNWAVLFSLNTSDFSALADGARITTWQGFTTYGAPTVQVIDGIKWEKNSYANGDGFNIGQYASGIPAEGVTIVAVVKPEYTVVGGEPRGEIVDIFYGELYLAVNHGNGEVIVCTRGYSQHNTGYFIPNGQKTVLSLVVNSRGNVELFANGESKWTYSSGADYSSLLWYNAFNKITVGRNGYDGWSTFIGNIGDVYVFKTVLDDRTRQTLQANLAVKFGIPGVPFPPPFGTTIFLR